MTDRMKELFFDIENHLLSDEKPSLYLRNISQGDEFKEYPFDMLSRLKTTNQSPKHHPEGTVWEHTMLVIDEAAKVRRESSDPVTLMWAALLHDIGKPSTTKLRKGHLTSYGHHTAGAKLAEEFLTYFGSEHERICKMVLYHMEPLFVEKNKPFKDIKGLIENTDVNELALLSLCDRLGRFGTDKSQEIEMNKRFIRQIRQIH